MAVYTGNPSFSATLLPEEVAELLTPVGDGGDSFSHLFDTLGPEATQVYSAPQKSLSLDQLFVTEFSPRSQYDQLIELVRSGVTLPDRLACFAGSGSDFHGFKGRSWAAVPGNLHLAVHFAPGRPLPRFGPAFTALAALSVVDALDGLPGVEEQASVKWVNDVLLGGAKVAGTLAFTQSQDSTVSCAVIGIGLNVDVAPAVARDPSVPRVGCVRELLPGAARLSRLQGRLFLDLLQSLEENYDTLLEEGAGSLIDRYRERSAVVGKTVDLFTDSSNRPSEFIARGRVRGLGDNLELLLEGEPEAFTSGRLIIRDPETSRGALDTWNSGTVPGTSTRSSFAGNPL